MIRKSITLPLEFFIRFFKLLFLDIFYYSNFFQLFFIRNFTLLFTFVFFHNYRAFIYMNTLADFPFHQCRVR